MKLFLSSFTIFSLIVSGFAFAEADKRDTVASVENEIAVAVEAGKITADQAAEKLAYIKKYGIGPKKKGDDLGAKKWAGLMAKIKDAVAAGKITQEQADKKIAGLKEEWGRAKKKKEKQWDSAQLKKEIDQAVASGEISKEVAQKKYDWVAEAEAKEIVEELKGEK